jgi:hypothetical protein
MKNDQPAPAVMGKYATTNGRGRNDVGSLLVFLSFLRHPEGAVRAWTMITATWWKILS